MAQSPSSFRLSGGGRSGVQGGVRSHTAWPSAAVAVIPRLCWRCWGEPGTAFQLARTGLARLPGFVSAKNGNDGNDPQQLGQSEGLLASVGETSLAVTAVQFDAAGGRSVVVPGARDKVAVGGVAQLIPVQRWGPARRIGRRAEPLRVAVGGGGGHPAIVPPVLRRTRRDVPGHLGRVLQPPQV